MKRLRYLYYSAKYAALAWLDRRVKWRWLNDACWDAVEAKHRDALEDECERWLELLRASGEAPRQPAKALPPSSPEAS